MTASTPHSAATTTTLSPADELILTQVFDPESSPDTPEIKIDPSLPSDPHIPDPALLQQLQKRELEAIRLVENYTAAVASTDLPNLPTTKHAVFTQALALLAGLLDEHPSYASAYNNRAQLRRWHVDDAADAAAEQQLALQDLDTAIKLASSSRADGAVSAPQAKLLAAAWTQRGAVFWGMGQRWTGSMEEERQRKMGEGQGVEWAGWDGVRLEEEGSRCFFMAGLYGSEIGRTMAVRTNPYARLCGGIVREAMKREGAVGC
jgi:hypothetical protein